MLICTNEKCPHYSYDGCTEEETLLEVDVDNGHVYCSEWKTILLERTN